MAIPAQLPAQIPVAHTAIALEQLALRPGQSVQAQVVGTSPGGATQIAVGGQTVELALTAKLQPGSLVQLLFQGSGAKANLVVVPSGSGSGAGTPAPATPAAVVSAASSPSAPATPTVVSGVPNASVPAPSAAVPAPSNALAGTAPALVPPGAGVSAPATSAPVAPAAAPAAPGISTPATIAVVPSGSGPSAPVPSTTTVSAAAVSASPGASAPATPAVVSGLPNAAIPAPSNALAGTAPALVPAGAGVSASATSAPANPAPAQSGPGTTTQTTTGAAPAGKAETTLQPLPVQANPTQQVIAQTAQASVMRQDSVGTLLASLTGLGGKLAAMPEPVARAGLQLLAARINVNGKPLDGAALKDALLRSGSLFESGLQKGAVPAAQRGDMKASLLALRGALQGWLGKDTSASLRSLRRPAPPMRGSIPRADPPSPSQLAPGASPKEAARMLLAQTESALARMRLTQIASLPEIGARATADVRPAGEWHFELPLAWGSEMSMAQFRISRDGGSGRADQEREWQMRFSINFSEIGEVSAHASLRGKRLGVMIWAERDETAKALDDLLPELEVSLSARGIEPGALRVKNGVPDSPAQRAGHFMDGRS